MWKNYIEKYDINEYGEIKNHITNRILKPKKNHRGYLYYGVSIKGKYKDIIIHRAVAETFIPNPNNLPQVNHKDGNKLNNCVDNLEWVTAKENMIHATKMGLNKCNYRNRKVIALNEDGEIIYRFNSMAEAATFINGKSEKICLCCKDKIKRHRKLKWKYDE